MKDSAINCTHCGNEMTIAKVKKYTGSSPLFMLGLGLLSSLFLVGPIIGLPMILIGLYMVIAKETVKLCPSCGFYYRVYLQEA